MSMSVCLSVCSLVGSGCGSVFLWQRCDTLSRLHRVKFGELWTSNPAEYEDRFIFATTGQKLTYGILA